MARTKSEILEKIRGRGAPGSDGILVIPCEGWDDFVQFVRVVPDSFVFRGHARAEWRLQSELERLVEALDLPRSLSVREQLTDGALERFRERAVGYLQVRPDEFRPEEWMALGRQHGLVTPLLDWSKSPFVSAFFAFTDLVTQGSQRLPRGVQRLDPQRLESVQVAIWGFEAVGAGFESLRVIEHLPWGNIRQAAQRGVYTWLRDESHLDLAAYLRDQNATGRLLKWTIPASSAEDALNDLDRMNVTWSTLFADLTGAALTANSSIAP